MQKLYDRSTRQFPREFPMAVAAAFLLLSGCHNDVTTTNPPTPVRVTTVSTSDTDSGVRYSANVVANSQVNLAFKSSGYVETISQRKGADGRVRPLETGDTVASGEVLASVRHADYTDRVAQAKAQVAQAAATFEHAHQDFLRASNLFSTESITKAQFDSAKASDDSNAAALENAKAALSQAETGLRDCVLRSPLSGWVLERQIEVGSLVGTGSPAFTIADTHVVKAVFGLPDTMIHRVRLGDPQSITTISVPGELRGRITSISPSADPKSRVFSVEVTIPNSDNRLKSGMIATLALANEKLQQPALVVPLSAVVRSTKSSGGFAVFVVSESGGKTIARERDVMVGMTIGNNIAVMRGLQPGEQVVSVGASEIRDGNQVQVLL